MGNGALGPADGQLHRGAGRLVTHRVGRAVVEGHQDVAAERKLNIHGRFGREQVLRAVQVGAENDALPR